MRFIISTVGKSLISNLPRAEQDKVEPQKLIQQIFVKGEVAASAETNALSHIIREGDALLFLYSDTHEGDIASQALTGYYSQKSFDAKRQIISGLDYTYARFMWQGL